MLDDFELQLWLQLLELELALQTLMLFELDEQLRLTDDEDSQLQDELIDTLLELMLEQLDDKELNDLLQNELLEEVEILDELQLDEQ